MGYRADMDADVIALLTAAWLIWLSVSSWAYTQGEFARLISAREVEA